jgi:hypothetical protein
MEIRIEGDPTPEEEAAIIAALEELLATPDEPRRTSRWALAGRLAATRRRVLDQMAGLANPWAATARPWRAAWVRRQGGRGDVA